MAPAPRAGTISYGPRREPGVSAIRVAVDYPGAAAARIGPLCTVSEASWSPLSGVRPPGDRDEQSYDSRVHALCCVRYTSIPPAHKMDTMSHQQASRTVQTHHFQPGSPVQHDGDRRGYRFFHREVEQELLAVGRHVIMLSEGQQKHIVIVFYSSH